MQLCDRFTTMAGPYSDRATVYRRARHCLYLSDLDDESLLIVAGSLDRWFIGGRVQRHSTHGRLLATYRSTLVDVIPLPELAANFLNKCLPHSTFLEHRQSCLL
jgi:hypothetical protein